MMRNSRKLLTLETEQTIPTSQNPIYDIPPETLSPLSSNNSSSSSKIKSESSISTSSSSFGNSNSSPPFDSSIALTLLVLLTALFFVGLFSIYIRRFAEDSSVDLTRRRRGFPPDLSSSPFAARMGGKGKGVDLAVLQALPVYAYGSSAKLGTDASECAICLSEYGESECVKVIPICGHVFHVSCIDAWLSSHVTCPLCRTVDLFSTAEGKAVKGKQVVLEVEEEVEVEEETVLSVAQVEGDGECNETELRLREDGRNTWNGERDIVGPIVLMRRTSSSPWLSERVVLQRTLSF
ncbi:hypothetical protein Ancab_007691 [Ancistrocladus abbreviatus]